MKRYTVNFVTIIRLKRLPLTIRRAMLGLTASGIMFASLGAITGESKYMSASILSGSLGNFLFQITSSNGIKKD